MNRDLALRLSLAVGFAFLTGLCARLEVPMAPVPMTMQTFAVLLAGCVLGPVWGGAAIFGYLALAAAGLPLLSDGAAGLGPFTGPTAGYLFAFPIAAVLAGLASRGAWFGRPARGVAALAGLHLLILGLGAAWLATRIGAAEAMTAGFTPFLVGAVVKSCLVWGAWRLRPRGLKPA